MLEREFGRHNYRIYRLADGEGTRFVCDVLRQHRRIRNHISFISLYESCNNENWAGAVDPLTALRTARDLNLSRTLYIPELIRLCRKSRSLVPEIAETVRRSEPARWLDEAIFASWLGVWFGQGILLAMTIGLAPSDDVQELNKRFAEWQEGVDGMPMIGALRGLGHEYDEFLMQGAGALVTLLIALAPKADFCLPLLNSLVEISKQHSDREVHNIIAWVCHASAFLQHEETFEYGISRIVSMGGLSRPFLYSISEDDAPLAGEPDNTVPRLSLQEFRRTAAMRRQGKCLSIVEVALAALDDNNYMTEWNTDILKSIWSA